MDWAQQGATASVFGIQKETFRLQNKIKKRQRKKTAWKKRQLNKNRAQALVFEKPLFPTKNGNKYDFLKI